MNDYEERRTTNGGHRKSRVAASSISAPLSILVAFLINEIWGKSMSQEVVIAVSTLVGALVSTVSVCFYDLRGMLIGIIVRRRGMDRKRK